jgi:CheY-like chemotaxis protein
VEQLRRTVLVVDDDDDIAQLLEEFLTSEGYAVAILKDGRVAAIQEAVARHQPDCILLDGGAGTNYGDSWDSAAMLARHTPAVPVIMFTAHTWAIAEAQANQSPRSQAAGFSDVLMKPFELSELIRVVEQAVARSRKPD